MRHGFWMCIAVSVATQLLGLSDTASAQVTFDWATVGNPGNAEDPFNSGTIPGIGSVADEYRIATHEVTNDQYTAFLNAVAATDTNALYNPSMDSDARGGITQGGVSGSFTYSVKTNMGNKPVNFVSFFDAMRFVNWLDNGQPTGAQDASTTEEGVYTISDGLSETRAGDAQFFIPTENEWYKAAYHQPSASGGDADDYWLYPTASNSVPTPATADATGDISNPGANVANYNLGADWNGQLGNLTTVGTAGPLSESFYGTSDQGGNVWEWNEVVRFGCCRGLRGGLWFGIEDFLRSSFLSSGVPAFEKDGVGFRVASPVDCNGNGVPDSCDIEDLTSDDCNDNGIPDECDIANCDAGDPSCDDCNLNSVPDGCDVDPGDPDGVPDECTNFDGGGGDQNWSTADNWEDDTVPVNGDNVTIDANNLASRRATALGQISVILDVPVTIDSLRLLNGATLDAFGTADLTIVAGGGILLSGDQGQTSERSLIRIANNRTIDVEGSFTIDSGGLYEAQDPSDETTLATLDVAEVEILSRCLDDAGGEMNLTGEMVVNTSGDFVLDASRDCLPCSSGGGLRSVRGGKTRPTLRVQQVAAVSVGGNFVLIEGADIEFGSSEPLVVEGSFVNQSTCPDFFNWTTGGISFDVANSRSFPQGPGGQSFEVAGRDLGPSDAGFAWNFAVGEVEVASGRSVKFVDTFDNDRQGQTAQEALYVKTLRVGAGATVEVDNCSVYYQQIIPPEAESDVVLTGTARFEQLPPTPISSPVAAPPPHDILKNRYISIDPRGAKGNNPSSLHIRVMLNSSQVSGQAGSGPWWAGQPNANCISVVTTTKPAVEPDWTDCDTAHLTGCPIIPTTTYALAAESGGSLSAEILLDTQAKPGVKWHGDAVGFFDDPNWTAPNLVVNADDFLAAIKTFQDPNAANATHVSVTDMAPNLNGEQINLLVNINDVFSIIKGFQGFEYPGPDLTKCP